MRNFIKHRFLCVFLFYAVAIGLLMPPMSNPQEIGDGSVSLNNADVIAVESEIEYHGNSIEEDQTNLDEDISGEYPGEAQAKMETVTRIPSVNADHDFRLIGTAVVIDSGKNLAIIEHMNTGQQRAYWEGSRLDRFLVKRILWDKVILAGAKGEITLSMGPGQQMGSDASLSEPAFLDRKEVDAALPDYMSLVNTVSIRTHFHKGTPGGILIYNIDPEGLFGKIGLKDGDVIKAVNGEALAVSLDAVEIYDRLKKGGSISLSVRRGEENMQLYFHVG